MSDDDKYFKKWQEQERKGCMNTIEYKILRPSTNDVNEYIDNIVFLVQENVKCKIEEKNSLTEDNTRHFRITIPVGDIIGNHNVVFYFRFFTHNYWWSYGDNNLESEGGCGFFDYRKESPNYNSFNNTLVEQICELIDKKVKKYYNTKDLLFLNTFNIDDLPEEDQNKLRESLAISANIIKNFNKNRNKDEQD